VLARAPAAFGVAALTLMMTTTCLPLAMIAFSRWQAGSIGIDAMVSGIAVLTMLFGGAMTAVVAIGVPTWLILRAMRRETMTYYGLAGALAGAISTPVMDMVLQTPQGNWKTFLWLWGIAEGSLAALVFWRMATGRGNLFGVGDTDPRRRQLKSEN
jgi:hypothetical protein